MDVSGRVVMQVDRFRNGYVPPSKYENVTKGKKRKRGELKNSTRVVVVQQPPVESVEVVSHVFSDALRFQGLGRPV